MLDWDVKCSVPTDFYVAIWGDLYGSTFIVRMIDKTVCVAGSDVVWGDVCPDNNVNGANMGPTWGRQDPGGPHDGPMNFVIWVATIIALEVPVQAMYWTWTCSLLCLLIPWYICYQVPLYWHGLTLIPAWIINYAHCKVWVEITYPFPNFNGCTVKVWGWISNFMPYFTQPVI